MFVFLYKCYMTKTERNRKYPRFLVYYATRIRFPLLIVFPLLHSVSLCSFIRFLSVSLFLSYTLSAFFFAIRGNFGQYRMCSCKVGPNVCCASCRTYKRMRLFPGSATCATLRLSRGMRMRNKFNRSRACFRVFRGPLITCHTYDN